MTATAAPTAPMQKVLSSNHHRNVLGVIHSFTHEEFLTDMTFICKDGEVVYAHRKVLAQVSTLLRRIISTRPKDERIVIVLDDVDKSDMTHFLSFVYKGEAKSLAEAEIDVINQLCNMLQSTLSAIKVNRSLPKANWTKEDILLGDESKTNRSSSSTPTRPDTPSRTIDLDVVEASKQPWLADKNDRSESKNVPPTASASSSTGRTGRKRKTKDVLYCICREPEKPGMIGCDYCEEWFHASCLNLSKKDVEQITKVKWMCPNCELKKSGNQKRQDPVPQKDSTKSSNLADEEEQKASKRGRKRATSFAPEQNKPPQNENGECPPKIDSKDEKRERKESANLAAKAAKTQTVKVVSQTTSDKPTDSSLGSRTDSIDKEDDMRETESNTNEVSSNKSTAVSLPSSSIIPKKRRFSTLSDTSTGSSSSSDSGSSSSSSSSSSSNTTSSSTSKVSKASSVPQKRAENAKSSSKDDKQLMANFSNTANKTRLLPKHQKGQQSPGSPKPSTSSIGSSDELHFCYICKSIFVTKLAKEQHMRDKHP